MICDCGHKPSESNGCGTGYGQDPDGKTYCYECGAASESKFMQRYGKVLLYLVGDKVTNWPGTLRFDVLGQKQGKHNIAGTRIDVWFKGPDNHLWWGVQYGKWSDICHCKRTKEILG